MMRNSIHISNPDAILDILSSKDDIRNLFSPTSSSGNRINTSRQSSRVGGLNNQSFLPIQGMKRTMIRSPISNLEIATNQSVNNY